MCKKFEGIAMSKEVQPVKYTGRFINAVQSIVVSAVSASSSKNSTNGV